MSDTRAQQVTYTGRVQGVGFRYSVKNIVTQYDVCGWVKNLPDGRVELWAQGEEKELEAFVHAIEESHLQGFISKYETASVQADPNLKGFKIRG